MTYSFCLFNIKRAIRTPAKVLESIPSVVLLSATFGLWLVLQHTPRDITSVPPEEVTLPPVFGEVSVMVETAPVIIPGTVTGAVTGGFSASFLSR
jgi:hypothetical protein